MKSLILDKKVRLKYNGADKVKKRMEVLPMSRIFIDYEVVQSQTTQLRSNATAQLNEADSGFASLRSSLDVKDSLSNAKFIQASESDRRKAQSATRGITKLLNFISGSAEQMKAEDMRLSGMMRQGTQASPTHRFGTGVTR
jgi:hypothetical protein